MSSSITHWNDLHHNPRFRPIYPNEDVVRFLLATSGQQKDHGQLRLLDIGTGAGRHMKLAGELGFSVYGLDISLTGLTHARERLQQAGIAHSLVLGSMTSLPFGDSSFHTVISYGTFYYGTAREMQRAIAETHRVLAAGGRCFLVLRSTNDYRYGKGREIEPRSYQLEIPDTNELNTVQHFLRAEDVSDYFGAFSRVSFEKVDFTFGNRTRLNSDWLVTAEK